MKIIVRYACDICGEEYGTMHAAQRCEAHGLPTPTIAVGDIVLLRDGFGWFDGDPIWVSNLAQLGRNDDEPWNLPGRDKSHDGSCFSECCMYQFYYVVTAIDRDDCNRHRLRYHVWTKAMTGTQGYAEGWTYDQDHIKPRLVNRPPKAIVNGSKNLVGRLATHLL